MSKLQKRKTFTCLACVQDRPVSKLVDLRTDKQLPFDVCQECAWKIKAKLEGGKQ